MMTPVQGIERPRPAVRMLCGAFGVKQNPEKHWSFEGEISRPHDLVTTVSVPSTERSMRMFESLESRTLLSFSVPITSGGAGHSVAVADFNADGLDDVVV